MVPVQYRDETDSILDYRYEEETPPMGSRVRIGFEHFDVLYRWRSVPTSCIVYVRPSSEGVGA